MRREQRLRAGSDFKRVRREGRSWAVPLLVLYACRREDRAGPTRVGITAGRRVGGAVVRNRARRRLREALRIATERLEEGWDLVFIVRPAAARASYQDIADAADALLERAGLVSGESP